MARCQRQPHARGERRSAGTAGRDAKAELRGWYLRRLRPKLALAVREQGISPSQAASFDHSMQVLLGLDRRATQGFGERQR